MLSDPRAIEIISKATQKNVALPKRFDQDFQHIFADFFAEHDFRGQQVLELGPGQYDFAQRARQRGATVRAIDRDPAVLELGRYFGFDVVHANLRRFDAQPYSGRFDGLFCKFSINAFWFDDADDIKSSVASLCATLKPDGWGWVAPWNGIGKRTPTSNQEQDALACQAKAFVECGWQAFDLDEALARRYGISGEVSNHALFVRNLSLPPTVEPFAMRISKSTDNLAGMNLR